MTAGVRNALLVAALAMSGCLSGAPTPAFRYAKEGGCRDVFLYKASSDERELLWISAEKESLQLPEEGEAVFDLEAAPEGLIVSITLWEKKPRWSQYCTDCIDKGLTVLAKWKAIRGRLTLTLQKPEPGKTRYAAKARLEDVEFDDGAGRRACLQAETIEATVGWLPGGPPTP